MRTFTSCDFACWAAEEDECHCSCGGANHGALSRGEKAGLAGTLKHQMKKLNGIYELIAVGDYFDTYSDGKLSQIKRDIKKVEGNVDFILKKASKQQIEKWEEVKAVADRKGENIAIGNRIPYLLWKLVLTKEQFLKEVQS